MIPGPFKIVTTTELSSSQATVTFSDFSGIPTGSKHLVFLLNTRAVHSSGNHLYMRFNSDSGTNYSGHNIYTSPVDGPGTAPAVLKNDGLVACNVGTIPSSIYEYATSQIIIPHYSNTANHKAFLAHHVNSQNAISFQAMHWLNTAAITRVDFTIGSGVSFDTGSVFILAVMDETYNIGTADISSTGTATFSSIGGTDEDLVMIGYGRANGAYTGDTLCLDINGDSSSSNRQRVAISGYNSSLTAEVATSTVRVGHALGNNSNANRFAPFALFIQQYADSTSTYPHIMTYSGSHQTSSEATSEIGSIAWKNTSAITTLQPHSHNSSGKQWLAGSYISLYKLPRNRILNHDLSSTANPLGGSLSSTTSDVITGSLYARSNQPHVESPRYELNDTESLMGQQFLSAYGTSVSAGNYASASSTYDRRVFASGSGGLMAYAYTGGPLLIVKPHKTDRYKTSMFFSGSPYYTGYPHNPWLLVVGHRWASTASITKIEFPTLSDSGPHVWAAGSQVQIEALEPTAATSGFFLRFL